MIAVGDKVQVTDHGRVVECAVVEVSTWEQVNAWHAQHAPGRCYRVVYPNGWSFGLWVDAEHVRKKEDSE